MHRLCYVLVAHFLFMSGGCAFVSLNPPRPNDEGELSVGLYGGGGVGEEGTVAFVGNGVMRAGLGDGFELGTLIGNLGCEANLKYGLTDYQDNLQVSPILSLGLYGFSLFDPSIGVLAGYDIGDVLIPYVGFRAHLVAVEWPVSHLIGGMELFLGEAVSLLGEVDSTLPLVLPDEMSVTVVSLGLNLYVGRDSDW